MISRLLLKGMLVGVFAGLLAFGFIRVFAEPQIDLAIAFEEHKSEPAGHSGQGHDHGVQSAAHEHGHEHGNEVSRQTQAGVGALIGTTVFGAAVGGLFALAFCFLYGRVGSEDPRKLAAYLALACFIALVLVPSLKYPANPPAVGSGETIAERTVLFFSLLLMSAIALAAVTQLVKKLSTIIDSWNARLAGVLAYTLIMGIILSVLPTMNETPNGFSPDTLWSFRLASMGTQATLWATIGVLFGLIAERTMRTAQKTSATLVGA